MRPVTLCAFIMLVAGCGPDRETAQASRVEVRAPDFSIRFNAEGSGQFLVNEGWKEELSSPFAIDRAAYARLLDRIAPFEAASGPTAETSKRFLSESCPANASFVTDVGMISIRWIGRGFDRIYIADLGCDREKNETRNRQLRAILHTLPVPQTLPGN